MAVKRVVGNEFFGGLRKRSRSIRFTDLAICGRNLKGVVISIRNEGLMNLGGGIVIRLMVEFLCLEILI